jgi:hypothetical protein
MKASQSWKASSGWVLHCLIGGIMLLAGSAKVLGLYPPEQIEKLGLSKPIQVVGAGELFTIQVVGAGELVTALLLLIPRTASLGVLLTSSFWGGAICLHLSKGETFVLQTVFLLLTWVGAYLRVPGTFASFAGSSPTEPPIANATKALVA